MNKTERSKLQKYYKSIKTTLTCNAREKNRFLNDFKSNINDYISRNPECTFSDIENEFGEVEAIVASFHTVESATRTRKTTKRMKVIACIGIVVAAIVISLLVYLLIEAINSNNIVVT